MPPGCGSKALLSRFRRGAGQRTKALREAPPRQG
jgi:hypothetical protein